MSRKEKVPMGHRLHSVADSKLNESGPEPKGRRPEPQRSPRSVTAAAGPEVQGQPPQPPLRLEWVDADSLADNPANWRRHPENQLRALEDVIAEVGWAGTL